MVIRSHRSLPPILAALLVALVVGAGCRKKAESYDQKDEPVAHGHDVVLTAPSGTSVVQPTPPPKPGTEARKARALHGIDGPTKNLEFLDDQGSWYTPFDHPGMPGPYDLRGWHERPAGSEPASRTP